MKEKLVISTPPAEKIIPKDDTFHGSPKRLAAEWWYFDAIFNNNYSVHLGFKTFSKGRFGLISPMIEIYRDGNIITRKQKIHLFKDFRAYEDYPKIGVSGKTVIDFDNETYLKNGRWIYNYNLKIDDYYVDLDFFGLTEGFKIETKNESWVVPLPKARVKGEIRIKNEKVEVEGIGYHDHNWNYSLLSFINYGKGWYWGKVCSKTFTITWAKIMKSSHKYESIAIFNKDRGTFYNIDPRDIDFKFEDFSGRGRNRIPRTIIIKLSTSDKNDIRAYLVMKAEKIHFSRALVAPYWRYHMKPKGFISFKNKKERVEDVCIVECLKFGI